MYKAHLVMRCKDVRDTFSCNERIKYPLNIFVLCEKNVFSQMLETHVEGLLVENALSNGESFVHVDFED